MSDPFADLPKGHFGAILVDPHERIERLVAGPYLELFARQRRPGWTVWGNEIDKFSSPAISQKPTGKFTSKTAGAAPSTASEATD